MNIEESHLRLDMSCILGDLVDWLLHLFYDMSNGFSLFNTEISFFFLIIIWFQRPLYMN